MQMSKTICIYFTYLQMTPCSAVIDHPPTGITTLRLPADKTFYLQIQPLSADLAIVGRWSAYLQMSRCTKKNADADEQINLHFICLSYLPISISVDR